MKKLLALLLAMVMVFALAACNNTNNDPSEPPASGTTPSTGEATDPTETQDTQPDRGLLSDYTYGEDGDYTSLYEAIGEYVTIDDVYEIDGLAYVEYEGKEYELGADFLSMAMVYKCEPEGTGYETATDIYNEWWRLYMQRWNYLVPEIPLYSNDYYFVYNAKIKNFEISPFWSASKAVVEASVDTTLGSNSVILGSNTDLSGSFRYAIFGKSSPGASDLDVQGLTTGLATVAADRNGDYIWNDTVVESWEATNNDDGSKTYTIKIYDDMVFSDGSPITAKNYLVHTLVFGSPIATEAASRDHNAGMNYVGYKAYHDATETTPFAGLRLIDDYTFSVTIDPQYLPYYYDVTYASFDPVYLPMWLGENFTVADDGEGAYIKGLTEADDWYAKDGDSYVMAAHIAEARMDINTYPYSGPYVVSEWDASALTATMTLNPNFKGTLYGTKPTIEKVSYIKVVQETQNDLLVAGGIDVLCDITGGDKTDAALAIIDNNPGKFESTYYSRPGYGKLGFRADFGPVYFTEVRQAIMYSIDRNEFAQQFTGGYGSVVHGAYYLSQTPYLTVKDSIILNQYAASEAAAIAVLEEGGWIYNAEGGEYTEGIRYKKLAKSELTEANLAYASLDGTYKTVEVNGEYYMPLVINWFCTTNNDVSEMLKTAWAGSPITEAIGMNVQYTQGDFNTLQAEYGQDEAAGYTGPALYSAFNLATGFTSGVYDFSWNWTIDPDLWDSYSYFYIMDEADFYWFE